MNEPAGPDSSPHLHYARPVHRRVKVSVQEDLAFAGAVLYSVLALPAGVFVAVTAFARLFEVFFPPSPLPVKSENLHDVGRLAMAGVLSIASALYLLWRTRHGTRANSARAERTTKVARRGGDFMGKRDDSISEPVLNYTSSPPGKRASTPWFEQFAKGVVETLYVIIAFPLGLFALAEASSKHAEIGQYPNSPLHAQDESDMYGYLWSGTILVGSAATIILFPVIRRLARWLLSRVVRLMFNGFRSKPLCFLRPHRQASLQRPCDAPPQTGPLKRHLPV